jgi:phosphohistidine phosphatase SixA
VQNYKQVRKCTHKLNEALINFDLVVSKTAARAEETYGVKYRFSRKYGSKYFSLPADYIRDFSLNG